MVAGDAEGENSPNAIPVPVGRELRAGGGVIDPAGVSGEASLELRRVLTEIMQHPRHACVIAAS